MRRVVAIMVLALIASVAYAQDSWKLREYGVLNYERPAGHRDRGFAFCTLRFKRVRTEPSGSGWDTDWPKAQANIMLRLAALTTMRVEIKGEHAQYWVVPPGPDLNTCAFAFTSDYGTLGWRDGEAAAMRDFLLRGGILWVDDAWGWAAWEHWTEQMALVLPERGFEELPADHPVLMEPYRIELTQISNIGHWQSRKTTSERGEETAVPKLYHISDDAGRLMVLASHNTDLADPWEHDRTSEYFERFGAPGYAIGVNVILYAMTH